MTLLHKRFDNKSEVAQAIVDEMKGGVVEIYERTPDCKSVDYILSATWYDRALKDNEQPIEADRKYIDFTIFYCLTRANQIYITEVSIDE